mmetsp:Transcript_22579/g.85567  ORF Transcript_22579/g.85567 Transcript_22579/m.85567 type:complete len:263 (+) Transcript_22579:3506-4294(+)
MLRLQRRRCAPKRCEQVDGYVRTARAHEPHVQALGVQRPAACAGGRGHAKEGLLRDAAVLGVTERLLGASRKPAKKHHLHRGGVGACGGVSLLTDAGHNAEQVRQVGASLLAVAEQLDGFLQGPERQALRVAHGAEKRRAPVRRRVVPAGSDLLSLKQRMREDRNVPRPGPDVHKDAAQGAAGRRLGRLVAAQLGDAKPHHAVLQRGQRHVPREACQLEVLGLQRALPAGHEEVASSAGCKCRGLGPVGRLLRVCHCGRDDV